MIFGVFIIDFIFEYIQSQSYNMDLIFQCVIICMGFIGFYNGPLNKEEYENEKKRVAIWEKYYQLKKFGDKLSDEKKSPIEEAFAEFMRSLEKRDDEAIDSAMEKINTAWTAASEEIYKASQDEAANSENVDSKDTPSDDVKDVEFEE